MLGRHTAQRWHSWSTALSRNWLRQPSEIMNSRIRRLLTALWVPPFLGVAALLAEELAFPSKASVAILSTHHVQPSAVLFMLAFASGATVAPALVWFGLMEVLWTKPSSRNHARYIWTGSLLGLILGVLLAIALGRRGYWTSATIQYGPIGFVCGLLVSYLNFKCLFNGNESFGAAGSKGTNSIGKTVATVCLCMVGGAVGSIGLLLAAGKIYLLVIYHLPSEEHVRQRFIEHRRDFIQFVDLVRSDSTAKDIDDDGEINQGYTNHRRNPAYGSLLHKVGAKRALIREDGSVEFTMWGAGGAIWDDSYIGIRYHDDHQVRAARPGWEATVVQSLEDKKLPQENGRVATGLYAMRIEANWYVYRFEYQE